MTIDFQVLKSLADKICGNPYNPAPNITKFCRLSKNHEGPCGPPKAIGGK